MLFILHNCCDLAILSACEEEGESMLQEKRKGRVCCKRRGRGEYAAREEEGESMLQEKKYAFATQVNSTKS